MQSSGVWKGYSLYFLSSNISTKIKIVVRRVETASKSLRKEIVLVVKEFGELWTQINIEEVVDSIN